MLEASAICSTTYTVQDPELSTFRIGLSFTSMVEHLPTSVCTTYAPKRPIFSTNASKIRGGQARRAQGACVELPHRGGIANRVSIFECN